MNRKSFLKLLGLALVAPVAIMKLLAAEKSKAGTISSCEWSGSQIGYGEFGGQHFDCTVSQGVWTLYQDYQTPGATLRNHARKSIGTRYDA